MPNDRTTSHRLSLSDSIEVFVYPEGLAAQARKTARNRRLGCWPLFSAMPVAFGIFLACKGGPDSWIGFVCAAAFILGPVVFEHGFSRHTRRSLELAKGYLTYDGRVVRQHDAGGVVLGEVDPGRKMRESSWHVAGNYVVTLKQGEQSVTFTSGIDEAKRLCEILKIGNPGDWGD